MLATDRLILRQWREADKPPFAAMNADPEVMEFMPSRLSRPASDGLVDRFSEAFEADGVTFYALEERATGDLVGAAGLFHVRQLPFAPTVEIGWRLRRQSWGKGYATEAARAALAHGFGPLGFDEIVAFTAVPNLRSQRVMDRIGMVQDPDGDFDHPAFPEGHRLCRHVLFRLRRPAIGDTAPPWSRA